MKSTKTAISGKKKVARGEVESDTRAYDLVKKNRTYENIWLRGEKGKHMIIFCYVVPNLTHLKPLGRWINRIDAIRPYKHSTVRTHPHRHSQHFNPDYPNSNTAHAHNTHREIRINKHCMKSRDKTINKQASPTPL